MSIINNSLSFRGNSELLKDDTQQANPESHIARNTVIAGAVGAVAGTADSFRRLRNSAGGEAKTIKWSDIPKDVRDGISNALKALKEHAKTLGQKLSPENARKFIINSFNAAKAVVKDIPTAAKEGVEQVAAKISNWGTRTKTIAIWTAATAGLYLAYEGISSLFNKKAE